MKPFRAILGSTIIIFGLVFLAENLGYINFPWLFFLQLWPLLLIIWGLTYIIKSTPHFVLTLVGIFILLGSAIAYSINNGMLKEWKWTGVESTDKQRVGLEYNNEKEAKVKIIGGAGVYNINSDTSKLVEAKAESTIGQIKIEAQNSNQEINISQNNFTFNGWKKDKNIVDVSLNNKPEWTVEMNCGAISSNIDLSNLNIKKFTLSSGATSVDLRLGAIAKNSEIEIQTGASSINIKIPKEVGAKVVSKTGLSERHYNGFDAQANGTHQTSNYEESKNKINFLIQAGFSTINIERY